MDRYIAAPSLIEARWLLLRVAGIAATAALVAAQLPGDLAWLLALAAAVVLYAVPSELGRHLVYRRAETLAPRLLQLLRPAEVLVVLIADPLHWLASRLAKDVRSRPPSASLTETEVEMIVSEGELNGSLDHEQSEMIRNVLDFGEVTAEEVMVPRIHVDALEASMAFPLVLEEVKRTRHSRYPVYSESVDNILGVLHVKDLFTGLSSSAQDTAQLRDLVRKPVAFVAEGQLASTVLKDMRAGRHHMAVVIDEFGGFSGVVTLEDLLEEIVGDIQDEHDGDDQARIKLLGDGGALIDASLPVTDVNRQLGTDFPEGDYVSLGGLILDHLGGVPATGTRHEFLGCSLIIREADERHVALIELTGLPLTSSAAEGSRPDDSANPP
jgi:putative hemolysin